VRSTRTQNSQRDVSTNSAKLAASYNPARRQQALTKSWTCPSPLDDVAIRLEVGSHQQISNWQLCGFSDPSRSPGVSGRMDQLIAIQHAFSHSDICLRSTVYLSRAITRHAYYVPRNMRVPVGRLDSGQEETRSYTANVQRADPNSWTHQQRVVFLDALAELHVWIGRSRR
jgi:hypothetical protein